MPGGFEDQVAEFLFISREAPAHVGG